MGPQIVLCMKVLSIEFDLYSSKFESEPPLDSLLGYFFHPATVVFGPWVSFQTYESSFLKINRNIAKTIGLDAAKFAILSSFSLLYSSCFTNFVLGASAPKWLKAYFVAQSFRSSHYFVQYISSMSATVAGFSLFEDSKTSDDAVGYSKICYFDALSVELPRSMGSIASQWNLYMKEWFKKYVFLQVKPFGVFVAVLAVYLVSALLHGAKFQISSVLLTIGIASYAEYELRIKLSHIFSACIQSSPCAKSCQHLYKSSNPLVFLVNFCFTLLNMFHLIYLGAPFDNSSASSVGYNIDHTLSVWNNLAFSSHYVTIFTLTLAKSI